MDPFSAENTNGRASVPPQNVDTLSQFSNLNISDGDAIGQGNVRVGLANTTENSSTSASVAGANSNAVRSGSLDHAPTAHFFKSFPHVFYVTPDGSIYECWWNPVSSSWTAFNLMKDFPHSYTFTPAAYPQKLATIVTVASQHVFYIGRDKQVHELYFYDVWKHSNLNTRTNSSDTADATRSSLGCFNRGNTFHIFFISPSGDIHQYLFTNEKGWEHFSISQQIKSRWSILGSNPDFSDAVRLAALPTGHVFFNRKPDDKLHLLQWNSEKGKFVYHDVTVLALGKQNQHGWVGASHDRISAYLTGTTPNCIVRGKNNHLYWFTILDEPKNIWQCVDLTVKTNSPLAAGPPSGYAIVQQNRAASHHVLYRDINGRFQELYHEAKASPQWLMFDLTPANYAPHHLNGDPTALDPHTHMQSSWCIFFCRSRESGHVTQFEWRYDQRRWIVLDITNATRNIPPETMAARALGMEPIPPAVPAPSPSSPSQSISPVVVAPPPSAAPSTAPVSPSLTQQSNDNPATASDECVICLERKISSVVLPCAHACMCVECAQVVLNKRQDCPICRGKIQNVMKIFLK